MSIRTICAVVTASDQTNDLLSAAIAAARTFDAHLSVIAIGIGFEFAGGLSAGIYAVPPTDLGIETARETADTIADLVRKRMASEDIRHDVETRIALQGGLTETLGHCAMFADLVIVARPQASETHPYSSDIVEAALFGSETPVLVVPSGMTAVRFDGKALIGWDDSLPALHATRAALPILKMAASVQIAMVEPPQDADDRSDPGGALAQFLNRHGAKCEIFVMTKTAATIAETLQNRATEAGCEVMIMGAYGHGRLRQAVFGGVTRHMLEHATLPILMAH